MVFAIHWHESAMDLHSFFLFKNWYRDFPYMPYVTHASVQFSCSVVSDSCDLMDCSTPGLPVHHQLLELTQTHVHCIGDSIQPSHPLLSSSPPTFNLSQHQGLFQWVILPIRWPKYWSSAIVLPMNTQDWSPLGWTGWISLQSRGLSRVFSNTTV